MASRKPLDLGVKTEDLRAAYHEVFSSPSGQVVLRDMYQRFYKKDIFIFESSNCALNASHAAGQREILESIQQMLYQHETGDYYG